MYVLACLPACASAGAARSLPTGTPSLLPQADTLQAPKHPADSSAQKPAGRKKSSQNDTWFYGEEPNKRAIIDTGIFQLHRFDRARRDGPEFFNLGNTGSEAYPLVFEPSPEVGFNMGFHQFDLYRFRYDSIRYYQVIRPYAEIFYALGLAKEQVFEGRFANFHKKTGILYGVDFRRIYSNGTYSNQKSDDNGFALYGIYNSKDRSFNIESDLIYNSFVQNENGGIGSDIFFNPVNTYLTASLAPVNLNYAVLNYNEINWFLKACYNVGPRYTERINDTLEKRVTMPVFKASYQFDVQRNRYSYFDLYADSPYYSGAVNGSSIGTGDTLRYNSKFIKLGNRVALDFNAKKRTSDSTFSEKNFLMGAALDFDYYLLSEFENNHSFGNLAVSGYLKSNPALNSRLIYQANAAYYVAGYNQNDLSAQGRIGADLRPYGRIVAGAGYQLKQSDWIYHSYKADSATALPQTGSTGIITYYTADHTSYRYYNNFPKMSVLRFGGEYSLDRYGIRISAWNYVLKNYFYFSGPFSPAWETNAINMLVLSFSNRFGIKGIHIDNDVWFQKSAGSDVVRLPLVSLKSSVYYERHVFRNALWFAIGADLRYYTPFNTNAYNPATGQFYLQDAQQMSFYPILDVFLNLKIKTVRVFLTGTNLSSYFGRQSGYYTSYWYPAAAASFKFGGAWRFFE